MVYAFSSYYYSSYFYFILLFVLLLLYDYYYYGQCRIYITDRMGLQNTMPIAKRPGFKPRLGPNLGVWALGVRV